MLLQKLKQQAWALNKPRQLSDPYYDHSKNYLNELTL